MAPDYSDIELQLVKMVKNYGHFFDDKELVSDSEDWLYICDTQTYDLLLVQAHKKNTPITMRGDWHGRKCYEYLEGLDHPCSFCPMANVRRDSHYVWTYHNELLQSELFLKDIIIDWNGRPAKLQTTIDITSQERRDEVMQEYIQSRNILTNILSRLMDEMSVESTFQSICKDIGLFFGADRVIITDYCSENLNTCWSADGTPFMQITTKLSPEGQKALTAATNNMRYISIPDLENAVGLADPIKKYWISKGIRSMLLIPLHYNGEFAGTLSLHNISKHMSEIDTLTLIGMAIIKNIYSHKLEAVSEAKLYTDPLTGALNLSGLKKQAYNLFRENPGVKYSIAVCDIRYFGGINRRFSFELGDRILKKTAANFAATLGPDETFCRISADQFCVVRKYENQLATRKIFEEFVEKMQCFDELSAVNVTIDYQAGVYIPENTGEGFSISQAIDKANIARRTLKDFHGSGVTFFSNDMLESNKREIELIQDFKNALQSNEITVYYQPQCRYSEKRIAGAEALVRWNSPKHGFVSPAEFIPLLERHGLIFELDRYVWELVCKHQRKWIDMGFKCPISVNVSRYDVLRNGICAELCGLLDKYGIPKELLPLEITETAYIKSSSELISVVDMLKGSGFIVEMDDFGSGYSSLNALKDVAVDLLKLDMKFLDMSGESKGRGGSILNCIVRMTRWLNLPVLAEGVETKEQAEYLKSIGCDLMQGYYFARPMPADEFEKILIENYSESDAKSDNEMMSAGAFMESIVSNPILFNHIGAAAIIEYHNKEAEALLINDSFFEMIDCTREEYKPYMKQMNMYTVDVQKKNNAADIFEGVVKGPLTHDFVLKRKDGSQRKIRLYCRRLLADGNRHILLLTLDDITDITADKDAASAV